MNIKLIMGLLLVTAVVVAVVYAIYKYKKSSATTTAASLGIRGNVITANTTTSSGTTTGAPYSSTPSSTTTGAPYSSTPSSTTTGAPYSSTPSSTTTGAPGHNLPGSPRRNVPPPSDAKRNEIYKMCTDTGISPIRICNKPGFDYPDTIIPIQTGRIFRSNGMHASFPLGCAVGSMLSNPYSMEEEVCTDICKQVNGSTCSPTISSSNMVGTIAPNLCVSCSGRGETLNHKTPPTVYGDCILGCVAAIDIARRMV